MTKDFNSMAEKREEMAAQLSDAEIWRSIVLKVINLDVEYDMKVDILIQSIPDIGVIFGQLKYFNSTSQLDNQQYQKLIQICIEKLEGKNIDFNPLKYTED